MGTRHGAGNSPAAAAVGCMIPSVSAQTLTPSPMDDLAEIIFAFFVGASALTGVLAISARIAFKPILESWLRLRQGAAAEEAQMRRDRRIQLLESELRTVQQSVNQLMEAEEFRRQLEVPVDPIGRIARETAPRPAAE